LPLAVVGYFAWIFATISFERPPRVQEVALGDLNGDGHLDAYLATAPDGEPYLHPDYLLLNDGHGGFTDSGQDFGNTSSFSAELGDVNGDGLLDIVVGWWSAIVYRNYGRGTFQGHYSTGDVNEGTFLMEVALADLNGDGSLDIFGAGCCGGGFVDSRGERQVFFPTSQVWLGDGSGLFSSTSQSIGQAGSRAVALADLNGDGTPDAFLANSGMMSASSNFQPSTPNTVWFNDGQGNFTDSSQPLGEMESTAVALGDVDGDSVMDAVVGNRGPDEIWFNDGRGNFTDSGQRLGDGLTYAVFLVDLDGDGVLDLVVAGEESAQVWLNDGTGQFSQGQQINYGRYDAMAVGDLTGDGWQDILVAGVEAYQLWRGTEDGRFAAGPPTHFK
jgi:hypothetical protein